MGSQGIRREPTQAIIHTSKGNSYTTSSSAHLYWVGAGICGNNIGDVVILHVAGSLKDT